MKERIIIVFVAVAIGILLTTVGFFAYESTKNITTKEQQQANTAINSINDSKPKTSGEQFITVEEPKNEAVLSTRTIQVKGKTNTGNTVIVSTNSEDQVAQPTSDGSFAITISIDTGINKIIARSISPEGNEVVDERIVTYSTEDF